MFPAPPGFHPSISSDGQIVAFDSNATDLVAGDTNGAFDVFVRDRGAGTTRKVSVTSAGAQAKDFSVAADISGDGPLRRFESRVTNLVAGDTNGVNDIFVRDLPGETTERVSVDSDEHELHGSVEPSISGDGRFVAFPAFLPGDVDSALVLHDRATGTSEALGLNADPLP